MSLLLTLQAIHFCGTDKDQDRVAYRSFISGEIVSFLSAVLDGDCESLQYIEDSTLMPVAATTMKKGSVTGNDWECGMPAYCYWREEPFP